MFQSKKLNPKHPRKNQKLIPKSKLNRILILSLNKKKRRRKSRAKKPSQMLKKRRKRKKVNPLKISRELRKKSLLKTKLYFC